jgi:hypothetical protein
MDRWARIKAENYISDNEPLVLYRRTWRERMLSKPWKCWTTEYVFAPNFDLARVLGYIHPVWASWAVELADSRQSLKETRSEA